MRLVGGWRQRGRAIVPVLLPLALALALASVFVAAGADDEDWASSPEAYFLTAEERAEWKALDSRESRRRFQERYWLKRDPSPGSERNEFKELVLARIRTADQRFRIQKTPGSRTARGEVFIVLGTPARTLDRAAPRPPPASTSRRLGEGVTPVAINEGNETNSVWFYEMDRTPRILEAIGRPSLEITIIVEPSRHQDSIQNPGLFHEIREIIASKSIVNPDLIPAAAPAQGEAFQADKPAAPREGVSAAVRALLDAAAPSARGKDSFAGALALFHETGPAEAVLWLYAPAPPKGAAFSGIVRSEDGRELAAWTEAASPSGLFSTQGDGVVVARRLPLPPGSYSVALALAANGAPLAASALPLRVPDVEKTFGVSSLLVTAGPAPAPPEGGRDPAFVFGRAVLPPRADGVFRAAGPSLWYFLLIANPKDQASVFLEPRLRRDGQAAGSLPAFAARLEPMGKGRFLTGVELPLATLSPGEYVLYVSVRDGGGVAEPELRRAEFRLVP